LAIPTGFQQKLSDDEWGGVQDRIKSVLLSNRSAEDVHVYEIMTKPVIPIPAEMDIRHAGRLNYRAGIFRAAVVENRELFGMISLSALILEHKLSLFRLERAY
jgi:CBS domain-containing protein